jgi:hypothetical protein
MLGGYLLIILRRILIRRLGATTMILMVGSICARYYKWKERLRRQRNNNEVTIIPLLIAL